VKTKVEQALLKVIPADRAGSFNQALMELGAIVCVPNGEPLCGQCPWHDFCETRKKGLWQELPVKKKAKARRIEDRTVLVIRDGDLRRIVLAIRIGRRTRTVVWQNIVFAFVVKAAVLILGAFGAATMWEAVFADVGVALLAILNAVRIQRSGPEL